MQQEVRVDHTSSDDVRGHVDVDEKKDDVIQINEDEIYQKKLKAKQLLEQKRKEREKLAHDQVLIPEDSDSNNNNQSNSISFSDENTGIDSEIIAIKEEEEETLLCSMEKDGRRCQRRACKHLYEVFHELICKQCQYDEENESRYKLMTLHEAKSQYLLTDAMLKKLPHESKDNPHNKHWNQMKLYLKKHVEAKAIERWGSLDQLQQELNKRNQEKYSEAAAKVSTFFSSSRLSAYAEDENNLNHVNSASSSTTTTKKRKKESRLDSIKKLAASLRSSS